MEDIAAVVVALRAAVLAGPGGKQVLLQDPSGNVVELFPPAAAT